MRRDWIEHLAQLAGQRSHHADVHCALGQARHLDGDLEGALAAFDRALELNPNYVDAALARCFVLGDLGRVREGFAQLRPLFGLAPDDFAIVFAIGVYGMRHGFTETGVAQLQRAATLQPHAAYPALFLAAALEAVGESDEATLERARAAEIATCMREAAGLVPAEMAFAVPAFFAGWPTPGLARAHVQRAAFLMQQGADDAAESELALAHARFPGHARVMVETGRLMLVRDRTADARRWFEAALAVDSHCASALVELSYLDAADDAPERALDFLRRAVELRPMFPDYRNLYGTLLLDSGRADDAAVQLEQALILAPDHGSSALLLANAYALLDRREDALEVLANGACRTWPEARTLTAELLANGGDVGGARALLTAVLTDSPDYPAAAELLASLGR